MSEQIEQTKRSFIDTIFMDEYGMMPLPTSIVLSALLILIIFVVFGWSEMTEIANMFGIPMALLFCLSVAPGALFLRYGLIGE
jgi:hypothetical protein